MVPYLCVEYLHTIQSMVLKWQMVGSIHEHKGKQDLFLEANIDDLKTLLEVALIQSTGASNRIEGIFTSDKRLEELVSQKAQPRNRSEQEIAGYREVLATIHDSYEYIVPRPNVILQLHRDLYSYSQGTVGIGKRFAGRHFGATGQEVRSRYYGSLIFCKSILDG